MAEVSEYYNSVQNTIIQERIRYKTILSSESRPLKLGPLYEILVRKFLRSHIRASHLVDYGYIHKTENSTPECDIIVHKDHPIIFRDNHFVILNGNSLPGSDLHIIEVKGADNYPDNETDSVFKILVEHFIQCRKVVPWWCGIILKYNKKSFFGSLEIWYNKYMQTEDREILPPNFGSFKNCFFILSEDGLTINNCEGEFFKLLKFIDPVGFS